MTKASTEYTPFLLTYGMESTLPIEHDLSTYRWQHGEEGASEDTHQTRLRRLLELEELRALATVNIEAAQSHQARYYNRRMVDAKPVEYKVGDLVMVFDAIRYKRKQKKFLPRYFGPFRVLKKYSNFTYDLGDLQGSFYDRINYDKLKLFHKRAHSEDGV